jgi:outer membrane protein assembly factor BamB
MKKIILPSRNISNKLLLTALLIVIVSLVSSGCMGSRVQGWSGINSDGELLFYGSMDGKVIALDPLARSRGITFGSEREWVYQITDSTPSGSLCGPLLSCNSQNAVGIVIYSTPVLFGDLVYVATYDGKIYAIPKDPINKERVDYQWIFPREGNVEGGIVGNLVLVESIIYFCGSNGEVYALDAESGQLKWEYKTEQRVWATPTVHDGIIYVTGYSNRLYAISTEDGSLIWQKEYSTAISSSPVVAGDTILFGGFDHNLYAVNKDNGEEKWKFKGGNWFWAAPLVEDNVVYAVCLDQTVYALNSTSGTQLWGYTADSPLVSSPVIQEDKLIVVSESGEVYSIEKDTGVLRQTVSIGYTVMSTPYIYEDKVIIHDRDDFVNAVDLQAGTLAWRFKLEIEK